MKRKRSCKDQNPKTPLVKKKKTPQNERTSGNITAMQMETEAQRTHNVMMEINTDKLTHIIASVIKEISKEASGIANLSRSLVNEPISNGQVARPQVELHQNADFKQQELNDALAVIKKTMNLNEADPFNRPVNPVALEIHDYFDIIKTPMDFGTICNNLENGLKYMNSADVFKDVEYIWHNCVVYNKKGDQILKLMSRVKTFFMKHWIATKLQTKQSPAVLATTGLIFCDKHNVCAYLDKSDAKSTDYHAMNDFLTRSKIHYAITVNPPVYENFIRDFWSTANLITDEDVSTIKAVVDGKSISITEATIRRVLRFDDATGVTEFPYDQIMATFTRMGYEGDFEGRQLKKTLLSYNWRFLIHICIQCLSSRKAGWDAINTGMSSAVVGLVMNLPFNFSNLIFQGMKSNVLAVKREKFLMYPRFLQQILNVELQNLHGVGEPVKLDHMSASVYTYMKSKNKRSTFSGTFTPLFGHVIGEDDQQNDVGNVQVNDDGDEQANDDDGDDNDDEEKSNESSSEDTHVDKILPFIRPSRSKRKNDRNPPPTSSSLPQAVNVSPETPDETYEPLKKKQTVHTSSASNVEVISEHVLQHSPVQNVSQLNSPQQLTPANATSDKPYDPNDESDLPILFIQLKSQVNNLQQALQAKDAEIVILKNTVASQDLAICTLKQTVAEQQSSLDKLYKIVDALVSKPTDVCAKIPHPQVQKMLPKRRMQPKRGS